MVHVKFVEPSRDGAATTMESHTLGLFREDDSLVENGSDHWHWATAHVGKEAQRPMYTKGSGTVGAPASGRMRGEGTHHAHQRVATAEEAKGTRRLQSWERDVKGTAAAFISWQCRLTYGRQRQRSRSMCSVSTMLSTVKLVYSMCPKLIIYKFITCKKMVSTCGRNYFVLVVVSPVIIKG